MNHHDLCLECNHKLPELKSALKCKYLDWLEDNEEMYSHFKRFAQEALDRNRPRFSAYMIRERVRWYVNIEYKGEYKISNNWTPYLARTLIIDLPALDDIFTTKDTS